MHVLTLAVAIPVIGVLSGLLTWIMGGTGWQIVGAIAASGLIVQGVYAVQLLLRYQELRREEPVQAPARERWTYGDALTSSTLADGDDSRPASGEGRGRTGEA